MTRWQPTQANRSGRTWLSTGFGVEHAGQLMTGVVTEIASSIRCPRLRGLVTAVTHQIPTTIATAAPT